jgi:hypothetical protein
LGARYDKPMLYACCIAYGVKVQGGNLFANPDDSLHDMGTGLFVNVRRGRGFAQASIETLTDDEIHDLLQRATPTYVRAYCTVLVQWIREQQTTESRNPKLQGPSDRLNSVS